MMSSAVLCTGMAFAQATTGAPAKQPAKPDPKMAEPKMADPKMTKPEMADPKKAEPKKDAAPAGGAPDMKAMEKAWEEAAKKGPQHEMLAKFEGEWNTVMTSYEMDGSKKTDEGHVTNKMVMGERFLKTDYSGKMMGKFAAGWGLMGYNNVTEKFESVWADSMGTGMSWTSGTASKDGKSVTLTGEMADPTSKTPMKMREIMYAPTGDTYKMEMYGTMMGKEMKMMDLVFTKGSKKDMKDAKEAMKDAAKEGAEKGKDAVKDAKEAVKNALPGKK
jgi:Protein of unknown function (DUF1579)